MPLIHPKKRRAETEPADHEEASNASPGSSPEPATQRRRVSPPEDDVAYGSDSNTRNPHDSVGVMVKKLVRLALACEYNRRPIRRGDITEKVLGSGTGSRAFKSVFQGAQHQLRTIFGMEMVELPGREKVTLQQKRAAQKNQTQASKAVTNWILLSILPSRFRDPAILAPIAAPTSAEEAKYTSLSTLLVSLITLSGGQLPDAKMERYLRRLGLEDNAPIDGYEKTEKLMKRLERDGYLMKVKESAGNGEEDIYWVVGPRGKIEVGEAGTSGLVKAVFSFEDGTEEAEELERKIRRSLGIGEGAPRPEASNNAQPRQRGRKRRDEIQEDDDKEEEEGEEAEDADH